MDLKEVCQLVAASWVFDKTAYPRLADFSEEEVTDFSLLHVLLHMQKSLGVLAQVLEMRDHDTPKPLDPDEKAILASVAKKMFVNSVRLAWLVDVSAEDLASFVQEQ